MLELIKSLFPILIKALIITIIVEEICLLLQRQKSYKIYLLCFFMNIIINVSMNIILQLVDYYFLYLIIFEIVVFVIEGLCYAIFKKSVKKGLLISFICNVCSLFVGMII